MAPRVLLVIRGWLYCKTTQTPLGVLGACSRCRLIHHCTLAIPDTMSSTTELVQEGGRVEKNGLSSVTAQSNDEDIVQVRKVRGVLWFLVVVAVLSATFLYALDNTVMANVRPSIVETFDRIDMLPWLSVSYPMGEVGANPLWFVVLL